MSRSRRHTPMAGVTTAESEKYDKRLANRRLRRRRRRTDPDDVQPIIRDVSDVWTFNKDGKRPFDPDAHPEMMRK